MNDLRVLHSMYNIFTEMFLFLFVEHAVVSIAHEIMLNRMNIKVLYFLGPDDRH